MKIASFAILLNLVLIASLFAADAEKNLVTVVPVECNEILANPGMGWETFGCTSREDKTLPSWIPSTVCYNRWYWGAVEPAPGKIDTEMLDQYLKKTREAGQKLAFRVSCYSTVEDPLYPKWLEEAGGKILRCDRNGKGPYPVPDLDDKIVMEKLLDLIARLGKRYDGHPDIDHVDLGSVGWFGEWHVSGSRACKMPSMETRQKVVAAYLEAFKKTPVLMLINGGECLKTATQKGAGWRLDCLGDLGGFNKRWNHMQNGYLSWLKQAEAQDVWKTAPVAYESCWDMRKWVSSGWPLRYIFNYALALHGSYLNNKSSPLPEGADVRPELERFLRRFGYRLVLKELKHPASVRAGEKIEIAMKWQNTGSAPCYRPYRLAYRLANESGESRVIASKVTVNRWLPGTVDIFTDEFLKNPPDLPPGEVVPVGDSFELPQDLAAGSYALSIGVVDDDDKPIVRLGIEGRAADGWYRLSAVQVEK